VGDIGDFTVVISAPDIPVERLVTSDGIFKEDFLLVSSSVDTLVDGMVISVVGDVIVSILAVDIDLDCLLAVVTDIEVVGIVDVELVASSGVENSFSVDRVSISEEMVTVDVVDLTCVGDISVALLVVATTTSTLCFVLSGLAVVDTSATAGVTVRDLASADVDGSGIDMACCSAVVDATNLGVGLKLFLFTIVGLHSDVSPEVVAAVDLCSVVCPVGGLNDEISPPLVGAVAAEGMEVLRRSSDLLDDCSVMPKSNDRVVLAGKAAASERNVPYAVVVDVSDAVAVSLH